jgi:DNA-binding response OmpR family regulator
MSIWVIDDDATLREVVREILEQEGFAVREFAGHAGVIDALNDPPELIVLDVKMPGKKGTDICREIRAASDVPIIFLSAANEPVDRIVGLELGADDYISKPFDFREFAARVHAVLRRHQQGGSEAGVQRLVAGRLVLDPTAFTVAFDEQAFDLTKTEFRLLETLMEQPRKVFSRNELMQGAYDGVRVSKKTIDSHIRRLRSNFEPFDIDPVRTVRGVGYALQFESLQR